MKILHVISNYFPAHGGPQYTMKHLSEKMNEWYNDEVEVITTNSYYGPEMNIFKKIEKENEIINGVVVKRFSFRRWHYKLLTLANKISGKLRGKALPYSIMKKKWALDCVAIDKEMKNSNANVIMATTAHYTFCDYPFWRNKTNNPKPFVLYGAIHFHVDWAKDSPFIKRALACDCYIANTDFERDKLINDYGADKNKIVSIGTGINTDDYVVEEEKVKTFKKLHQIKEDEILIAHIGRLSEGKGTGTLLDAFEKLYETNKKVKLLLAGTKTEYVSFLQQKIQKKNLPVILIENFSDAEKAIMFNATDIFVLASTGESFGVVFLEAWSCKKPVIGTKMGATASLISEGKDGLLFEPKSVSDLASKLQELSNNKDLRTFLGNNGYAKILEKYTWEIIIKKYREAYQLGIDNFIKKDLYSKKITCKL